jgi:ClpP class serine protease
LFLHALTNEEQLKKEGLTPHLFTTGPLKGMGADGLPLTEEQKAHLQKGVDTAFAMFKGAVLAKRPSIKPSSMTGGVYYAEEAKERGLIDGIVNDADALIAALNS